MSGAAMKRSTQTTAASSWRACAPDCSAISRAVPPVTQPPQVNPTIIVATMDPVQLRPEILAEHAALARAISRGHADKAARLMAAHFQAQYDYYSAHWPSRLQELIEWR